MEFLDYYDEEGNFLGSASRDEVHEKGLWHNTVHCWLYTKSGDVLFQIRKDKGTFYTTASGHVLKGESISEAFQREIKEEIGLSINCDDAVKVNIVPWIYDKIKGDGTIIKDRAKANVYVNLYEGDFKDFKFDNDEVSGVVVVNAKETKELFSREEGRIKAKIIKQKDNQITIEEEMVGIDNFLVTEKETALSKYKNILDKVIELTN